MKINDNFLKIQSSYLFSNIAKKVNAYVAANPDKPIIRLGIGDVTRPLADSCIEAMHKAVDEMANEKTFMGYPPEYGHKWLLDAINENDYKARGVELDNSEIFVSDGAKSDCGNIGDIFSTDNKVAVCDPVYPVYVDTNVMSGRSGDKTAEVGVIFIICLVMRKTISCQSFQRKRLILFIFVSLTTQQVWQQQRMNLKNGLIMLTKMVL